MQTTDMDQKKDIQNTIHDIKSSLQSLMVANELIMEDKQGGEKNDFLLKTMMTDIKKVFHYVDRIEKNFESGGRYGA